MGLLDAFKQYVKDAMPGGLLNPEVPRDAPKQLAGLLADFTPVVGDVKSAYDGYQAAREGDYLVAGLGALGALPLVPNMAGVIGKHHTDILGRLKSLPDDLVDASFGHAGNIYATPMRPFENSQLSQIGGGTPIAERLFSTGTPLDAKAMQSIEALPVSDSALNAFAKELSNEGATAMLNKNGRMSVVMPSTKGQGFQMTEFDSKGAIGDSQFKTKDEAIRRMIDSGYSKIVDESSASRILNKMMGL